MHRHQIRERALEAQQGKRTKTAAPVVSDPEAAATAALEAAVAAASKKARPTLSQVEQERADDEGMTRPDDD